MQYKDLIALRHSVRQFTSRKIDRELLDGIVEDAMLAPSSRNSRSSGFMIIEDPSVLEAISQMRDSGSTLLKGAAAAILVLGDADKTDLWLDNASISATYILLSATERGLGSCWVHINGRPRSKSEPDGPSAEDYVRELLNIKENMRLYCIVALGYEAEPEQ